MTGIDRKAANAHALRMQKLARSLIEPKPAEDMLADARKLQVQCAQLLRLLTPASPIGSRIAISDQVQPDLEAILNDIAGVLSEILEGYGFALFLFEFGEDNLLNYISNAHRDDMVATLREFIAAHEGRIQPTPETDQ